MRCPMPWTDMVGRSVAKSMRKHPNNNKSTKQCTMVRHCTSDAQCIRIEVGEDVQRVQSHSKLCSTRNASLDGWCSGFDSLRCIGVASRFAAGYGAGGLCVNRKRHPVRGREDALPSIYHRPIDIQCSKGLLIAQATTVPLQIASSPPSRACLRCRVRLPVVVLCLLFRRAFHVEHLRTTAANRYRTRHHQRCLSTIVQHHHAY